jgi:hypothetical protein
MGASRQDPVRSLKPAGSAAERHVPAAGRCRVAQRGEPASQGGRRPPRSSSRRSASTATAGSRSSDGPPRVPRWASAGMLRSRTPSKVSAAINSTAVGRPGCENPERSDGRRQAQTRAIHPSCLCRERRHGGAVNADQQRFAGQHHHVLRFGVEEQRSARQRNPSSTGEREGSVNDPRPGEHLGQPTRSISREGPVRPKTPKAQRAERNRRGITRTTQHPPRPARQNRLAPPARSQTTNRKGHSPAQPGQPGRS